MHTVSSLLSGRGAGEQPCRAALIGPVSMAGMAALQIASGFSRSSCIRAQTRIASLSLAAVIASDASLFGFAPGQMFRNFLSGRLRAERVSSYAAHF